MYYDTNTYSYLPFSFNAHQFHPNYMTRNELEIHPQEFEALLSGIKKEASAIDLYSRLAQIAPDLNHRDDILQALERKKAQFNQFTNLYYTLSGRQPEYQIDMIPFQSYEEGLQRAHSTGIESFKEYRKNGLLTLTPLVQNVFLHASNGELENATRFSSLNEEIIKDYGSKPYVVDIEEITKQNNTFRTALWTGEHLQLTLMSIGVGEDIGLERHPNLDQFIRIEDGEGLVQMGDRKDHLDFQEKVSDDFAIFVPAGKWHNLTNTGNKPIKLYSIYAPPQHPFGTVHETKAIAMAAEENHH